MLWVLRYFLLVVGAGALVGGLPSVSQAIVSDCQASKVVISERNSGTDFTISSTAVQVSNAGAKCQLIIRNVGAAAVRCLPSSQGAPTATKGWQINASEQAPFDQEGKEAWYCIRATGSDSTVSTLEAIP